MMFGLKCTSTPVANTTHFTYHLHQIVVCIEKLKQMLTLAFECPVTLKVIIQDDGTVENNIIHPTIIFCLIHSRVERAAARPPSPQLPPPSPPKEHQGAPRPAEGYSLSSVSWVCLVVFSQLDIPGTPHQGGTREHLNQMPALNHLNRLLLMWRTRGSTLRLYLMTELLILSLRQSAATKQISGACISDLVLSVTTHSS